MQKVRVGKYWCPKMKDVHPVACADPPKKDLVLEHLIKFAADKGYKLGITEKRIPDKHWALQMLYALHPTHAFFKKNYTPKKAKDAIMMDNADGFFDDLPMGPAKKRMGSVYKEPTEIRLKRQIDWHNKMQKKHNRKLHEIEEGALIDSDDDHVYGNAANSSSEDDDDYQIGSKLTHTQSLSRIPVLKPKTSSSSNVDFR